MSPKEAWEKVYKNLELDQLRYDDWLDKYDSELKRVNSFPIIDLGCGMGNNTLYLMERGYRVISCDFSQEALSWLTSFIPGADIRQFDMTEGLPFENTSAGLIIADLSLHYFDTNTTVNVLGEIERVLKPNGLFLCRVNSTNDLNYGAKDSNHQGYFYQVDGQYKRFFDKEHIKYFFGNFTIEHIAEYEMMRYASGKIVWEVAARKF